MTNLELALKHNGGTQTSLLMFSPEQLDAYSAELLQQASSVPFGYIEMRFIADQDNETGIFPVSKYIECDGDLPLYLANPINTEMVETIKRLEEALKVVMKAKGVHESGVPDTVMDAELMLQKIKDAKALATEALASISPAIKQQYLDN
jgi:hypothetical protein